jgi:hypothetical protein
MTEIPTICDHHFAAYHKYFDNHMDKVKSKLCSDPLQLHQSGKPNDKCPQATKSV